MWASNWRLTAIELGLNPMAHSFAARLLAFPDIFLTGKGYITNYGCLYAIPAADRPVDEGFYNCFYGPGRGFPWGIPVEPDG